MGRAEYLNDPQAPKPGSLVTAAGVLAIDGDGRVLLQRRRGTGQPEANDEASDVGWFTVAELNGLDVHSAQGRQLRDWIGGTHPHIG